ncbi:hypothetical protein ACRALDRAFT_1065500 [Sodiomyces alcalophilus JCM 7366]|uniref:uncharacterized protein n=1 Tax=Sodiomyces alcalophilus JCM 7366 TaxID=591952 RepID=UPI0039B4678D
MSDRCFGGCPTDGTWGEFRLQKNGKGAFPIFDRRRRRQKTGCLSDLVSSLPPPSPLRFAQINPSFSLAFVFQ